MSTAINIHLKNRCIETESKNLFKKMMDDYFTTDDEVGEFEQKIELLREFIENSDFKSLRASDDRLNGSEESIVMLKKTDNGSIQIDIK